VKTSTGKLFDAENKFETRYRLPWSHPPAPLVPTKLERRRKTDGVAGSITNREATAKNVNFFIFWREKNCGILPERSNPRAKNGIAKYKRSMYVLDAPAKIMTRETKNRETWKFLAYNK
jgi:hypothetical protein